MTHQNLRTSLLYTLNGRTSKKLPFELLSMRQKTTRFKCLTANHIKLFLVRINLMKKRESICRWWFPYKLLDNLLNPGKKSFLRPQDYGWDLLDNDLLPQICLDLVPEKFVKTCGCDKQKK